MKTAYLLARVDGDRVVEVGIFSEPRPTVLRGGAWLQIDDAAAPDFAAASAALAESARRGSLFGMGERCRKALQQLGGARSRVPVDWSDA